RKSEPGGPPPASEETGTPRGGEAMPQRCRPSLVRLAIAALGGGLLAAWAVAAPGPTRADADPVAWQIVDVTQTARADRQSIRWDYLVVLRETRGRAVQFESRESVMVGSAKAVPRVTPFRERLAPNSAIRVPLTSALPASGLLAARGVTMQWRFSGTDDAG